MRVLALLIALCASAAWAQKVVVLEIDGDNSGRLRAQIEAAVKAKGVNEVLSLQAFKEAAAKKKLKGAAAMTTLGVQRVGKVLRLDAAVAGEVTDGSYKVVIYDRAGQELWSRTGDKALPVKRGLLSEDFVKKLANAIAKAAETGASRAPQPDVSEGGGEAAEGSEEGLDLTSPTSGEGRKVVAGGSREDRDREPDAEPDFRRHKASKRLKVPLVRGWVAGVTTWRTQCLRPGVSSCSQYDTASLKPEGIVIDFTATVPYLGISGNIELFPLANFDSLVAQGFGVLAAFNYGASLTRIREETPQGPGPEKQVTSNDLGWTMQLAWRFHFAIGYGEPQAVGYAGVRFGLEARRFDIDPDAGVSLPSSQRVAPTGLGFPVAGVDLSFPISHYFRIEAGASLYLNPKPAPEQIIGYGNLNDASGGAESSGWGLEAGFSGDIYGPLGWTLRLRHQSFSDRYFGQGQKWTVCNDQQCGGVAQETYTSIFWGVTTAW